MIRILSRHLFHESSASLSHLVFSCMPSLNKQQSRNASNTGCCMTPASVLLLIASASMAFHSIQILIALTYAQPQPEMCVQLNAFIATVHILQIMKNV